MRDARHLDVNTAIRRGSYYTLLTKMPLPYGCLGHQWLRDRVLYFMYFPKTALVKSAEGDGVGMGVTKKGKGYHLDFVKTACFCMCARMCMCICVCVCYQQSEQSFQLIQKGKSIYF